MSNVLTAEAKKQLDSKARSRLVFVAAAVVAAGGLLACLSLAPVLISISTAQAALNAPSLEEEASLREDQVKGLRAQALITALTPLLATTTPTGSVSSALELLPAGVSVTSVSYDSGGKKIVLSGTSARREAVNAYRDALEASGLFSSVVIPVAALVGTQEGRFTITLTGAF